MNHWLITAITTGVAFLLLALYLVADTERAERQAREAAARDALDSAVCYWEQEAARRALPLAEWVPPASWDAACQRTAAARGIHAEADAIVERAWRA